MQEKSLALFGFVSAITLICFFLTWPLAVHATQEEALFAGGCFWCLEHDLEGLEGVNSVQSGYTGGELPSPTYRQVSSQRTGHQEAVRVLFDPERISYSILLRSYWRNVDPVDGSGQFCDRGDSYRPVIFLQGDQQEKKTRMSAESAAIELGIPLGEIKVELRKADRFWTAEDYHQDFAIRNSLKYNFYRLSCGRDKRLDEVWGQTARTSQEWQKRKPQI